MVKLSSREEVCPFPQVVDTEDVRICFNLLIGPLSLSIHLEVICSGEFDVVLKELCQFSSKGRHKLWTSIRYQGVMESKSFEHTVKEKFGHSSCVYGFCTRNENYPLCKAMVNHDHQ